MKTKRRFKFSYLLMGAGILAVAAIIAFFVFIFYYRSSEQKFRYGLDNAVIYGRVNECIRGEYKGESMALSDFNANSIYKQMLLGHRQFFVSAKKTDEECVTVDFGGGYLLRIWPVDKDNMVYISFQWEGKSAEFIMNDINFAYISRAVSPEGIDNPNRPWEDAG